MYDVVDSIIYCNNKDMDMHMNTMNCDMWDVYRQYDAICCTTNSVVKRNGALVMGAGIAKQFAHKYPWVSQYWGTLVKKRKINGNTQPGVILTILKQKPHLIYFQTKEHWKDKSNIGLINRSIHLLAGLIDTTNLEKILLPKPGCDNGGLNWETEVLPIIKPVLDKYPEIHIIDR